MSPQQLVMQPHASTGASGSFAELSLFMEKQQALLLGQLKEAKQDLQQQQMKAEQEMRQMRQEMEEKMQTLRIELTPREQPPAVTDEDLADLQARVKTLYASQTLTDEELYAVQDLCADYVELQASVPEGGVLTADTVYSKFYNCAARGDTARASPVVAKDSGRRRLREAAEAQAVGCPAL